VGGLPEVVGVLLEVVDVDLHGAGGAVAELEVVAEALAQGSHGWAPGQGECSGTAPTMTQEQLRRKSGPAKREANGKSPEGPGLGGNRSQNSIPKESAEGVYGCAPFRAMKPLRRPVGAAAPPGRGFPPWSVARTEPLGFPPPGFPAATPCACRHERAAAV